MTQRDMLQLVTPLPPLRTGIAEYSRDLLSAVDGRWRLQVIAERGSGALPILSAYVAGVDRYDRDLPTIVQLGNSEFHRLALEIGMQTSGVAVLHDVVLHNGLLAIHLAGRKMPDYWREVWDRYGRSGYEAGQALLRGWPVRDIMEFPLCERYVERAALTIVHNRFAERAVRELVPGARVLRIPMGIPLPPLLSRQEARRALGWPESAFVVASLSHVNPNKRLPVVLRAIKRLAARLPETMFVVAGSRSPVLDIARQIRTLGLDDRVMVTGFVEEGEARLIAAAADVCVNLRYPFTGETSASLLRLLGAGKPVLVTDGAPSEDLPPDVGLRVPVDRLEVEYIAELLLELAMNDRLREQAGRTARKFVEECHAMGDAAEGYRQAVVEAFGIELPPLGDLTVMENMPAIIGVRSCPEAGPPSDLDRVVASAMDEIGLYRDTPATLAVSQAMVELGLDQFARSAIELDGPGGEQVSDRLERRLACPVCRAPLHPKAGGLDCGSCGVSWDMRDGTPDFSSRG